MNADSTVVPLLVRAASELGARIEFGPLGTASGCIVFASGYRSYFWHNRFELNGTSASRICQDKVMTAHFLANAGFLVPDSALVCADAMRWFGTTDFDVESGWRFARAIGLPVVVKPLFLSKGELVSVVHDEREYAGSIALIFETLRRRGAKRLALVQARCVDPEYRLVVLEGKILAAYRRYPLSVVGDGNSTVRELLASLREDFLAEGRDPGELPTDDRRIDVTLGRREMNRDSIPHDGQRIELLEVANLSLGGSAQDCSKVIHPVFAGLAARIAQTLHLTFCGIDIFIENIASATSSYRVLEVNSAPGLDDAVCQGEEQRRRVDALYTEVLRAIERRAALHRFEDVAGPTK